MIAFDTNILVHYLVEDDPEQVNAADEAFEKAYRTGEAVFVSQIVLCELVWVLARSYRQRKEAIVSALEEILRVAPIEVEGTEAVMRALKHHKSGPGGFSDYLIAERATAAGCERILTFDRDLWSDPRFVAPGRWAR